MSRMLIHLIAQPGMPYVAFYRKDIKGREYNWASPASDDPRQLEFLDGVAQQAFLRAERAYV